VRHCQTRHFFLPSSVAVPAVAGGRIVADPVCRRQSLPSACAHLHARVGDSSHFGQGSRLNSRAICRVQAEALPGTASPIPIVMINICRPGQPGSRTRRHDIEIEPGGCGLKPLLRARFTHSLPPQQISWNRHALHPSSEPLHRKVPSSVLVLCNSPVPPPARGTRLTQLPSSHAPFSLQTGPGQHGRSPFTPCQ
jgi:hypothetical protein